MSPSHWTSRMGMGAVLGLGLSAVLTAGVALGGQEQTTIKRVPVSGEHAWITAGSELYASLCVVCHGAEGKGDGPAASALKEPLPDLTLLAEQNGGEFPELRVKDAILGNREVVAHGTREMPIWGEALSRVSHSPGVAELQAIALMEHVRSLQGQAPAQK